MASRAQAEGRAGNKISLVGETDGKISNKIEQNKDAPSTSTVLHPVKKKIVQQFLFDSVTRTNPAAPPRLSSRFISRQ